MDYFTRYLSCLLDVILNVILYYNQPFKGLCAKNTFFQQNTWNVEYKCQTVQVVAKSFIDVSTIGA